MTSWRVVRAPASRHGERYAVLSDREPGPVMGERGGLHGWSEIVPPMNRVVWLTFEDACQIAADGNGKPSTANMEPRAGEWAAWADAPFDHGAHGVVEHGIVPQHAAERGGAT